MARPVASNVAVRVPVSTAGRLVHDLVDDALLDKVRGGELERARGVLLVVPVAPQDGRARLGRDDRVPRVLEHQDAVADADAERAARRALADHHDDDRDRQARHHEQVAGDGLGLPALLGLEAGVRAGRVEERDDGPAELGSHFHEAERLAVALRVRHPEAALLALVRVAPLLVAENDDGPVRAAVAAATEAREAADQRAVVREEAVAVELDEALGERVDVVQRVRAARGGARSGRAASA